MGSILSPAIDAIRHIESAAVKANGVKGYRPQHHADGGECAGLLHEMPVLLKYELTDFGGLEQLEVTEVGVNGHIVPAAYFDADTRSNWSCDCGQARRAEGWGL